MGTFKKNEQRIEAYTNDHGQLIRVGDTVHYPAWRGYLATGTVRKIVVYDHLEHTWTAGVFKTETVKRVRLQVSRSGRKWDRNTGYVDCVRYINIYHTGQVFRIVADKSGGVR